MSDATSQIRSLICQHMPTAAVASGLASAVDPGPWVAEVSRRFPLGARPTDHSVPGLTAWLGERGVGAGETWVKALRLEWMKERMRAACDAEFAARRGAV